MTQDRPTTPQSRPVRRRRRSTRRSRGRPLRNVAIALLRKLIQTLEGTLERLEAEPQFPTRRRGFSGWVWGAIALAVAVGLFAFFSPNHAAEKIAEPPPAEEIRPAPPTPEPELPEIPKVEEPIPESEPEPPEISDTPEVPEVEEPIPEPEAEPPEIVEIEEPATEPESGNLPAELTAPNSPEPVDLIAPPAIARPDLSDSIRDRLAELSDRYSDNLIRSVDANFAASLLRVEVGEEWDELSDTNQNRLANQLFKKVRSLDFTRLEILDTDGKIIARNPVVGSEMILFQG